MKIEIRYTDKDIAELISIISWLGTFFSVGGSYVLATGHGFAGYSLFLVGAIAWIGVSSVKRDWAQLAMQMCFLGANIIGFARNL